MRSGCMNRLLFRSALVVSAFFAPVPLAAAGRQTAQQEHEVGQETEHKEEARPERQGVTDIHLEEGGTVTGTAIHEAPIEAPYPVATVSRDAIEQLVQRPFVGGVGERRKGEPPGPRRFPHSGALERAR